MIQLIIGLGNPGKEYATTRHNAGAWWLQAICDQYNLTLQTQTKFMASIADAVIDGNKVRLAIPTTYMNLSGQPVAKIANFYNIPASDILIAHDELDFDPGIIRFKVGGGHGGHNGLRDVMPQLKNQTFNRLRIGIGHPGNKDQVADYVLNSPAKSDQKLIENAIQESLTMLPAMIKGDFQQVMNTLHQTKE